MAQITVLVNTLKKDMPVFALEVTVVKVKETVTVTVTVTVVDSG